MMILDLFNNWEAVATACPATEGNPVNRDLMNAHILFRLKGNNAKVLVTLATRISGPAVGMRGVVLIAEVEVTRKRSALVFVAMRISRNRPGPY